MCRLETHGSLKHLDLRRAAFPVQTQSNPDLCISSNLGPDQLTRQVIPSFLGRQTFLNLELKTCLLILARQIIQAQRTRPGM